MNIYQRMNEVVKAVEYFQKENKGFNFDYVSSAQVLEAFRKALSAAGLLLVTDIEETVESEGLTKKGEKTSRVKTKLRGDFVNIEKPEEKITVYSYGYGEGEYTKAFGAAYTYAEKYLLLKVFHVPTDKDDPDSFQGEPVPFKKSENPAPEPIRMITEDQKKELRKITSYPEASAAMLDVMGKILDDKDDQTTWQAADAIIKRGWQRLKEAGAMAK